MPLPNRPRPGFRFRHQVFHQKVSSEAASSSSQLKTAVPTKKAKVEEEVKTNETMEDLNETRHELDRVRESSATTEEDRDMLRRLFEDCNKKQRQKIERFNQEYKAHFEKLGISKPKRLVPTRSVPRGQTLMELLTRRELSQTTES